ILGADLHTFQLQGQPPWLVPVMWFLTSLRLEREDCGRLYRFTGDLIGPDENAIAPHLENEFVTPVPENPEHIARMNFVLQMQGVAFPIEGAYLMQVRVEDQERHVLLEKRDCLRITQVAPQPQTV